MKTTLAFLLFLIAISYASHTQAQSGLTQDEAAAMWKRQEQPIAEAVTSIYFAYKCKIIDNFTTGRDIQVLEEQGENIAVRLGFIGQEGLLQKLFADSKALGFARATPEQCQLVASDPLRSGQLKQFALTIFSYRGP